MQNLERAGVISKKDEISYQQFMKLYQQVFSCGQYSLVKELLIALNRVILAIYEKNGVDNKEWPIIHELLNCLYLMTGNVKNSVVCKFRW